MDHGILHAQSSVDSGHKISIIVGGVNDITMLCGNMYNRQLDTEQKDITM